MIDLLENSKALSEKESVLLYFSTGKDSLVCLDLMHRFMPGKFALCYMWTYPGISYRERFIKTIEDKYDVKVFQEPSYDVNNLMIREGIKIPRSSFKQKENEIREKYKMLWLVYGYKKDDSLTRRGMLSNLPSGLDEKTHRAFPVAEWSEKHIFSYIKQNKIPLPVEYESGFRNIDIYKGESLLWLKANYPEDYEKQKKRYPTMEADILRAEK